MIFVTAFLNVNENRSDRGVAMRLAMFQTLVDTGVRLHVFVDPAYVDLVHVPNGVVVPIEFESLETYKLAPAGLPDHRLHCKDTREFMILMNAKLEFVKLCMDATASTHYAWIDFSVFNVLTNPISSLRLQSMETTWFPPKCAYFPGCSPPNVVWDKINWRFCGGFFLGDRASLYNMWETQLRLYPAMPNLVWEVNAWAHYEQHGVPFDWFPGNHDDSLLALPSRAVCVPPHITEMWSSPDFMFQIGGPLYDWIVECARPLPLTPLFFKSDGVFADDAHDRMLASLGRADASTIAARDYVEIEKCAVVGTKPLMCTHLSRSFTAESMLLVPWDDGMFLQGISKYTFQDLPWSGKTPTAVWRGGSSGLDRPSLRMRAVAELRGEDVKFVRGGWPFNDAVIPAEDFGESRTKYEQAEHKYVLVLDGNGPASNAQWVFGTGSVPVIVTHPENRWWFQSELVPMVNYVPATVEDLRSKLEWLRNNDAEAEKIARNARLFAEHVFSPTFQKNYILQQINARGK